MSSILSRAPLTALMLLPGNRASIVYQNLLSVTTLAVPPRFSRTGQSRSVSAFSNISHSVRVPRSSTSATAR